MKIGSSKAMAATGSSSSSSSRLEENSDLARNSAHHDSGVRTPPPYTRSDVLAPRRTSEERPATDGMRGTGRINRRFDPYARPLPRNPENYSAYATHLNIPNSFVACKLFDQIKAMLPADPARPGRPYLLEFEVDGRQYELEVLDSGTLMINRLNPPGPMLYSLKIEPNGAVGGMTTFPGGQENLARFLASASARLQYLTS